MSIGALGGLASGFASGLERGMGLAERGADMAWRKEQRGRQQKQWEADDTLTADLEAARKAGQEALVQDQKAYEAQWKAQQPGPTLDGGPVQPAPMQTYKPSPTAILKAAQARTDKLFQLGRTDQAVQTWAQDEGMRGKVRADAAQQVRAALAGGGDVGAALKGFYDTIDDGYDVQSVTPAQGQDGKPVLQISRVSRVTGQPLPPEAVSPQELDQRITMLSANPADVAKHSLAMKLEAFKQEGALAVEGVRQKGRMTLADVNNTSAEKRVERSASATEKAAEVRAGAAGKSVNAETIRALAQERTSVDNDVRTLVQQLKDARPTDRVKVQADLDEARARAKDVRRRLSELSAGADAAPEAAPADKLGAIMQDAKRTGLSDFDVQLSGQPKMSVRSGTQAPAATTLPKGAKQIGTSGGKPVYQTPDGKRFIQE